MTHENGSSEDKTRDFQRLGLNQIAYVKAEEIDEEVRYVVHTADGTAVTAFPSFELAKQAIRQHELMPVSIH